MPAEPQPAASPNDTPPANLWWLRWFLVACYFATMYYTWKVWESRGAEAAIPNLPLGDLRLLDAVQIPFGYLMLVALLAILVHPVGGLIAHTSLLLVAVILDQARLQPEFVSLTILLWGTLPWHGARLVARTHLIALWFFAGFHKLLSQGYLESGGPQLMRESFPALSEEYLQPAAVLVAIYEMSLGVLAAIPYARRVVPFLAAALHLGVVESLMRQNWNSAVWPWNIALAAVGFGLLWDHELPWDACRRCAWGWSVAAGFVLLSPLLFYACSFEAYLCHCLYSSNIPTATIDFAEVAATPTASPEPWQSTRWRESVTMLSFETLNVPLPPEHRLYEQFFRRRARPGDEMEIEDSRWWAARNGYAVRHFRCESDGTIVELPK